MKNYKMLMILFAFAFTFTTVSACGHPSTEKKCAVDQYAFTSAEWDYTTVASFDDVSFAQTASFVPNYDLFLGNPETITEPVKRTYAFRYVKRFDWRCQKK
jgi:hypothetical protein